MNLFWFNNFSVFTLKYSSNSFTGFFMYLLTIRKKSTTAVHKETELFKKLLIYLHLTKTCLLQNTPLHAWYTATNVFYSSGTHPGTCFAGWREGPVSNFLLSPLPPEIGDLLVRVSTSGTRNSPQWPNLESGAARGTTVVSCFVKNSRIKSGAWAGALSWCSVQVLFVHASGLFLRTASFKRFRTFR